MSDLSKKANDDTAGESTSSETWQNLCALDDLPLDAGAAALANENSAQETQIALFRVVGRAADVDKVFAIGNFDPFSEANVLARGILCSIDGELAVASPVLKEHFSLTTGECFEDDAVSVPTYPTKISDGQVFVQLASSQGA